MLLIETDILSWIMTIVSRSFSKMTKDFLNTVQFISNKLHLLLSLHPITLFLYLLDLTNSTAYSLHHRLLIYLYSLPITHYHALYLLNGRLPIETNSSCITIIYSSYASSRFTIIHDYDDSSDYRDYRFFKIIEHNSTLHRDILIVTLTKSQLFLVILTYSYKLLPTHAYILLNLNDYY